MNPSPSTHLSKRTWFVLIALSLTGQMAWAVENSWFNTFVYDTLTPDPRPIAWMVAASAITATLTTLIMGTLSDRTQSRWGRRRPYILFGYVFWGLSTILFPTISFVKPAGLAIFMVVAADSIMTFFGSTANDAAFNAWTADVAASQNRGRVEGALNLSVFIAQMIALAASGILIEKFGYFVFFYTLGGLVLIIGWIAGSLLQEPPAPADEDQPRLPFWQEFAELFNLDTLRQNKSLFILMLFIMLSSIGMNVAFPYMIVYLQNFIGLSKTQFSIVGAGVLIGSAILAIPFGLLTDRWNKKWLLAGGTLLTSLGAVFFSLARSIPLLSLGGFIWQAFALSVTIASVAWLKDLLPEDKRGKFLGVRMIFWIAIPMVVGPAIGSSLIHQFGIPTVTNGQAGFIPVPIIFQAGAAITLLALIPLTFLKPCAKKPQPLQNTQPS